MKKAHFTRKNLIILCLSYFYVFISVFCGICCDANYPIMKKNNPIAALGHALGFSEIRGSVASWILFSCFAIYLLLFIFAFVYEYRLATYYDEKPYSKKWLIVYGSTFVICFGLAFGIGIIAQYPYESETIANSFLFLLEGFVTGFIIFAVLLSLIGGAILLYVNFKNIDKPFRFFNNRIEEEKEEEKKNKEYQEAKEQGNLSASFGEYEKESDDVLSKSNQMHINSLSPTLSGDYSDLLKEKVFPGLCEIDEMEVYKESKFNDNIPLNELANKFRNYLASKEKLYFDITTIREFIAGLATSKIIILEGLSGTGKSSIARYFSDFVGEKSFFAPVQTTWRDRTSVLGFFNDFSKTYSETEFLKRLYRYSYKERNFNIMVLDEMNISRIEYYFADFLSVLEYPEDEWKIKIMQLPFGFVAPNHLEDGFIKIPRNTIFIGTANKDDSTYTITDKVYDRAITINFDNLNTPFEVIADQDSVHLSFDFVNEQFNIAKDNDEYKLNKEDLSRYNILIDFVYDEFDLALGNRVMNQINNFVPVFVGLGGKKEEALDFLFASKVISKLEGRYEDYIKKGLEGLDSLVIKLYGDDFKQTRHLIKKLLRKF